MTVEASETMPQNLHGGEVSSLLRISIFFAAIVIVSNFLIGVFAPTSAGLDDEISFLDTLWRVVVGQRVGIDYHNPMGFGPYQLGAVLWHWLGPHDYVMRLAIALFSLLIALCGCIVAQRSLARRPDLALLFCVTLAFQLSAPTLYQGHPIQLGIAEFYNRLSVSALAVLFLQTFGGVTFAKNTRYRRENVVDIVLVAFLLNVLFLIKISGFLLGVMILLAGCLFRNGAIQRVLSLCVALVAFAAITAIELKVTGLELIPIIKEYELAAHARLTYSLFDILRGVLSWSLVISITLLLLLVASLGPKERQLDFRRIALIVGSYAACQFALNMTNSDPSMGLAPAAAASLVIHMNAKSDVPHSCEPENWWRRLAPSNLLAMPVRQALPLAIFIVVLVPEVVASAAGTAVDVLVLLGIEEPYVVGAGRGVRVKSLVHPRRGPEAYERSLNGALAAITSLNLSRETIANLDHANPFPVLLLAPPPKGIYAWWTFGFNVPRNAVLEWPEVIGDACVVTIPKNPSHPDSTVRLVEVVRRKLDVDFKMVHQDDMWTVYRRTQDCATAPHQ